MKIMHCPQHMGEGLAAGLRTVAKEHPLAVGFTELDLGPRDFIGELRKGLPGYRICAPDRGQHSREVPIALREGPRTQLERNTLVQLSEDLPGNGTGNDRWMQIVRFQHAGHPYFDVAVHWNAAIQNMRTGAMLHNDRVPATVDAARALLHHVWILQAEGRQGWVHGDFNYRSMNPAEGWNLSDDELWQWSPQACFKKLGLRSFETGLDYLAWTEGLRLTADPRIIERGTSENPSDHPWIVGTFERKGASK
jgi:hypothetical protein